MGIFFLLTLILVHSALSLSPSSHLNQQIEIILIRQLANLKHQKTLTDATDFHRSLVNQHIQTPTLFFKEGNNILFYKDDSEQKSGSFKYRGVGHQGRLYLARHLAENLEKSSSNWDQTPLYLATGSTGNHGAALLEVRKDIEKNKDGVFEMIKILLKRDLTSEEKEYCIEFMKKKFHIWIIISKKTTPIKLEAMKRGEEFKIQKVNDIPAIDIGHTKKVVNKIYQTNNMRICEYDFKNYGETEATTKGIKNYLESKGVYKYIDHSGEDISAGHSTVADEIFDSIQRYEQENNIQEPLKIILCLTVGAGGISSTLVRLKQLCLLEGRGREAVTVAVQADYCKYAENLIGINVKGTNFPERPFADGSAVPQPEPTGLQWCQGNIDYVVKVPEHLAKKQVPLFASQVKKAYNQQAQLDPAIKIGGTSALALTALYTLLSQLDIIGNKPCFVGALGCEGNVNTVNVSCDFEQKHVFSMIDDFRKRTVRLDQSQLIAQTLAISA